jgi:hypothetical protein
LAYGPSGKRATAPSNDETSVSRNAFVKCDVVARGSFGSTKCRPTAHRRHCDSQRPHPTADRVACVAFVAAAASVGEVNPEIPSSTWVSVTIWYRFRDWQVTPPGAGPTHLPPVPSDVDHDCQPEVVDVSAPSHEAADWVVVAAMRPGFANGRVRHGPDSDGSRVCARTRFGRDFPHRRRSVVVGR